MFASFFQILGLGRKPLAAAGIVIGLATLAACGQTGSLYMPVRPVVPARPAVPAPAPTPDTAGTVVPPLGAASAAAPAATR